MAISIGIPSLLEKAATSHANRGISFLKGGSVYACFSYSKLFHSAKAFSQHLMQSYSLNFLERIAVALPSSPESVVAFFGILLAGAVPVPLPHLGRFTAMSRYLERMKGAVTQSSIRFIVTTEHAFNKMEGDSGFLSSLNITLVSLDIQKLKQVSPGNGLDVELNLDAPALVQYTSGSTSQPKGIVLTHRQLMANLKAIDVGLNLSSEDICCSWLPLFHDMGLIGCLLGSINKNINLLLMEPIEFIRDPLNWLKPIEEFGATITSAPNSGYLRCVQKTSSEDVQSLDLSSWRIAMNGAEFVDPKTMTQFAEHFERAQFNSKAFMPVYGMAEASLAVTFPPVGREGRIVCLERRLLSKNIIEIIPEEFSDFSENHYMQIASVGTAARGIEIQILSENLHLSQDEMTLGEICIRGSSVTSGYDSALTNISESLIDGWLKTGDLGFFYEGELYIVSRIKDVIVLNGENFYAHDIELASKQVIGSVSDKIMAFGLRRNGLEELIILVEISKLIAYPECQRVEDSMRGFLFSEFGITPSEIIFLSEEKLPRTSSGKLQRYRGAELYLRYFCNRLDKDNPVVGAT